MSNIYLRIDTTEVLGTINRALYTSDVAYTVKQYSSKSRIKNTRHGYEYTLDSLKFRLNGVDEIVPRIVMFNSYNRESALTINIGIFRFVCSNGLIVGESGYQAKVRHVKGQKAQEFLDMLYDNVTQAITWIKERLAQHLSSLHRVLTSEDQERVVMSLKLSPRVTNRVLTLVRNPAARRLEDRDATVYNLWQIVNEQMTRASRSELRNAERNVDLLTNILKAA